MIESAEKIFAKAHLIPYNGHFSDSQKAARISLVDGLPSIEHQWKEGNEGFHADMGIRSLFSSDINTVKF
ncbi:hypothetical protein HNY73_020585 [Argiope bruennichi]|uniref:Uncharacterized protein n=1 Tax=Argiope bruennichi TaxID=94029 RepID=A0A8T0E7A9_ARGBR|nr:hypothetical protein HNY73_020585 [Argiope bruennichi]